MKQKPAKEVKIMKVYDMHRKEFIDEKDKDLSAPPERYMEVVDDDFHLESVAVYSDKGCFIGFGMIDKEKQLLFSGCITCELAKERGFVWKTVEE